MNLQIVIVGLIMFALGLLSAFLLIACRSATGTLFIDEKDPDFATCGVKFNSDISSIKSKRAVILTVSKNNMQENTRNDQSL